MTPSWKVRIRFTSAYRVCHGAVSCRLWKVFWSYNPTYRVLPLPSPCDFVRKSKLVSLQ